MILLLIEIKLPDVKTQIIAAQKAVEMRKNILDCGMNVLTHLFHNQAVERHIKNSNRSLSMNIWI